MYYKVTVDETGRGTLKDEPQRFNQEVSTHKSLEAVKEYLVDRYGKIPTRKTGNTVYTDGQDGAGIPIGFLHSYWTSDISHNTKKWYQTDWVVVSEVKEEPVLVN